MVRIIPTIGLLIASSIVFIVIIAMFVKVYNRKSMIAVASAGIILFGVLALIISAISEQNTYIRNFRPIQLNKLVESCDLINLALEDQHDDIKDALTTDNHKGNLQIALFDISFRNKEFSNLKLTTIFTMSDGDYEKIYQINKDGQLFSDEKSKIPNNIFVDRTISLNMLEKVLSVMDSEDWFNLVGVLNNDWLNISYSGIIEISSTSDIVENTYILCVDPKSLVSAKDIAPGLIIAQKYYVFSIILDAKFINVLVAV